MNPFLAHIGSAHEETGLGNYLRALSAILLLPRLVDIPVERTMMQGLQGTCSPQKSQSFEEHYCYQWQPTPVLLPGKSHGRRSLVGCSPWGREESNMTGQLPFPFTFIAVSVNSIAENSNEMGFQAVAWPHCFRANREKMLILLTTSSIQVQTQYVSLQNPRIFQTDLGSLDHPTEKILWNWVFLFVCFSL